MKDQEFDVQEYQFRSFSSPIESGDAVNYEFRDLREQINFNQEEKQKIIKIEREHSRQSGFDISPIVRHHRGIKQQEEDEIERRIQDEVNKRVARIQEEAYQIGHEEGVEQGRLDILEQTRSHTDEKLVVLNEMISNVLSTQEELIKNQKTEIYKLIRNLSKWIILRELKEDGKYIDRLLEKLILECGTRANLLIQVDQKHFEDMPEILERIQAKLGNLTNVRIETDYDINGTGIVLQSENGIINATLTEQLNSLDKLFESVGLESTKDNNENKDLE